MSKKKFTSGLESLFTIAENETVDHYTNPSEVFSVDDTNDTSVINDVKENVKTKRSGKNFSADLGNAMQDAFVTSEDYLNNQEEVINVSTAAKRTIRKPLSGLDALLRRTIENMDLDNETKRRVVLIIESGKIEKLKEIAKEESIFLKDILERSVNFFIDDYERRKQA